MTRPFCSVLFSQTKEIVFSDLAILLGPRHWVLSAGRLQHESSSLTPATHTLSACVVFVPQIQNLRPHLLWIKKKKQLQPISASPSGVTGNIFLPWPHFSCFWETWSEPTNHNLTISNFETVTNRSRSADLDGYILPSTIVIEKLSTFRRRINLYLFCLCCETDTLDLSFEILGSVRQFQFSNVRCWSFQRN